MNVAQIRNRKPTSIQKEEPNNTNCINIHMNYIIRSMSLERNDSLFKLVQLTELLFM